MMKNYLLMMLTVMSLGLTACTTPTGSGTGTGTTAPNLGTAATALGTQAFKYAVEQKCRAEVNNYPAWQVLSKTLSKVTQTDIENKICGCVGEKAPQSVTAEELVQIAIDANARTQVIGMAVSKTLAACYTELTQVPSATTPSTSTQPITQPSS